MLATPNSFASFALSAAALLALTTLPCQSKGASTTPEAFLSHAEQARQKARLAWENAPQNLQAGCDYARTTADLAVLTQESAQRASLAQNGIETCQQVLKQFPNHGPAHYYLGLHWGLLAQTQTISAFKSIRAMERAMHKAIELDPTVQHAGPHRVLSLLYRDAPGWPVSVGSRQKAKAYIQKAIELAPQFPENRLIYLESLLKWGETETLLQELPATESVLLSARSKWTGADWAPSWADWDRMWKEIQATAQELAQKSDKERKD